MALIALAVANVAVARAMPEYTAAEAPKHIGEKATVVGKVECIDAGRTFHCLSLDGCLKTSPFWIIVNDDASGPDLKVQDLKGVAIAVTGQIEKRDASSHPWMVVKSRTQIQTRSALQIDHVSHAYDRENAGDIDGAMEELRQPIEQHSDRRDEAYQHLAKLKEKKGDWPGALATYDELVAADPKKAGSYYVRATAKKEHGDFEGAMADFSRAAELRSSGISLVEIGKLRKANGDSAGAMAEYDKAIAMLDRQIAGVQKSSDQLDLLYYHRGYAKELKGDLDGAVADYSQAIVIKPSYEAGAYSRRGDIKKGRGDLTGAIADYQNAVKYAQLPEDKEKLRHAQAESSPHKLSFNKTEVRPESIAEAFVQAYSGADVDAVAALYADRVDYTNSGIISNAAVRAQAKDYFARWPVRRWNLAGRVKTTSMGPSRHTVVFSATYDASNPNANRHASGVAQETLILASDQTGGIKIVSQKEQTSKRVSSRPDGETLDVAGESTEKLVSPDKSYSVEIMRGYGPNSSALALFNGAKEVARIPTEVGPVGSFFEALWSPDGKYVAINKQRSSRAGGDEMWIVALPTGEVLRQPDDALWNQLEEKADAFINEKGLNETGGKEFLTLTAIGWEKHRLRCRLEVSFGEIKDRYFFEGTVDPLHLKTIADWKMSTTKS